MTTPTEIIPCRGNNCEKKLRVPTDRGRLKVTCPDCGMAWEWSPADHGAEAAGPSKPPRVHPAIVAATALLIVCGVWTRAWVPTSLFLLAALAWWVCRRKASARPEETLLQKGYGALWEATAGVAGAGAVGFGAVIGLITLLNGYARLTPSRYPSWLPALEDGLFGISAWLQDSDNKTFIALTYIVLILLGIVAAGWARRHERQWTPVKRLSTWKQRITKAAVVLQAFTLFTFFSQAPINAHAVELEQQLRWRYGVAKRAEKELNNKLLLAEQLTEAARAPERRQEDRDDFAALIDDLRSSYQPPKAPPSATGGPDGPRPPGPNAPPPRGPSGWRPPSWPHPPGDVLKKIGGGEPLTPDDYRPLSSRTEPKASDAAASDKSVPPKKVEAEGRGAWESKAAALVSSQVESTKPPSANDAPAPTLPDPPQGLSGPIKTAEQWKEAKGQVAAQEVQANQAERRYGQAVQGALEAVCEYIGLQVKADPVVEAWLDLAINNLSERAYPYLMPGESSVVSRVATHMRRLLSPKESAAEKLVAEAQARIGAADYDGAERLVGDLLTKYPKTKASKQARGLAEECSFQSAKKSYDDPNTPWEQTIQSCSTYLDDNYDSSRSGQVRRWLSESKRARAAADLDARTPRMIVYVRDTCGNSQYFRQVTSRNSLVRSAMNRFKYELRDIDAASYPERLKLNSVDEDTLPIILFESKAGAVLNSIGGVRALEPSSLLATMRVVR